MHNNGRGGGATTPSRPPSQHPGAPNMAGTTPRRSPIPRPWLAERRYIHGAPPPGSQHALHRNHPHQDYRYLPPPLGASAYPYSMAAGRADPSMELLPRPTTKVSWSTLSCCFCPKSHQKKETGGAGTNSNPSSTKVNGQDPYRRRNYNDHGAFHGFPILRRHSSNSLMLNENEIYPSSGSVSSFTDSDTSHSEESMQNHPQRPPSEKNKHNHLTSNSFHVPSNDTFDSEELRRHSDSPRTLPSPRAVTPPAEAVMPKPPGIKSRSQSAEVPAMSSIKNHPVSTNPHLSTTSNWALFHTTSNNTNTPARQRIDTDFSRHSGTTNTSRHRRRVPYEFSGMSMDRIWQGKQVDEKLVLPSYVLLVPQNNGTATTDSVGEGSGYISALDDSETDWGTTSDNYDGDNDDEDMLPATNGASTNDGESYHKKQQHHQQQQHGTEQAAKRLHEAADRPPKGTSARRRDQSAKLPPKRPARRSVVAMVPTYLRKCTALDDEARGKIIVSGWVAASTGGVSWEERFRSETAKVILAARDIWYLQIIVDRDERARIDLRSSSGIVEHEIVLQPDWMCESREISSRIGRYVKIRSRSSLKTIVSLLPVSLEDAFFSGEKLVSAQQFAKLHDRMFVGGKGRLYAPDEQHDAAMYILFSLDTLIKNYVS